MVKILEIVGNISKNPLTQSMISYIQVSFSYIRHFGAEKPCWKYNLEVILESILQ